MNANTNDALRERILQAQETLKHATLSDSQWDALAVILEAASSGIEHLSALPAAGWRDDMENAPRDGTEILAIVAGNHPLSGKPFTPQVVFWSKRSGGWLTDEDEDGEYICGFTPTHWMPLPTPPSEVE